jgi:hypothetical protein
MWLLMTMSCTMAGAAGFVPVDATAASVTCSSTAPQTVLNMTSSQLSSNSRDVSIRYGTRRH